MLNRDMLRRTADAIERAPEAFAQSRCGNYDPGADRYAEPSAGRPAGVGGWVCWLAGVEIPEGGIEDDGGLVAEALGISEREAQRLAAPVWPLEWDSRAGLYTGPMQQRDTGFVPRAFDAAAVLRGMADSGKIWPWPPDLRRLAGGIRQLRMKYRKAVSDDSYTGIGVRRAVAAAARALRIAEEEVEHAADVAAGAGEEAGTWTQE